MALSRYEKETVILYNEEESTAFVCTHNERLRKKLANFEEKSDECCLVKQYDGYSEYKLPKSWVKVNMPRQYSDEQRREMAERARNNLSRNKEIVND